MIAPPRSILAELAAEAYGIFEASADDHAAQDRSDLYQVADNIRTRRRSGTIIKSWTLLTSRIDDDSDLILPLLVKFLC